jgi:hypothetical protein
METLVGSGCLASAVTVCPDTTLPHIYWDVSIRHSTVGGSQPNGIVHIPLHGTQGY